MNETTNTQFSVNAEAQSVIEETKKMQEECKLRLLTDTLKKVNEICSGDGIAWFALGKLLRLFSRGEDDYPDEYRYDIGLLRKDYDAFMKKCTKTLASTDFTLNRPYSPELTFERMTAYILNRQTLKAGSQVLDIEVRLYLQPFDILPEAREEREEFMAEACKGAFILRRSSQQYWDIRKPAGSLSRNPAGIPGVLVARLAHAGKERAYARLISRYSNEKNPRYIGRIDQLVYPGFAYKDIYPLKKSDFSGVPVYLPASPEKLAFLSEQEEMSRTLTGRLAALKLFDRLCKDHNMDYVAVEDLAIACSHNVEEPALELLETRWTLGMMRSDYEKAISLLKEAKEELYFFRSEPLYPAVCGERVGFCVRGYEPRLPRRGDGNIFLVPFDVLPDGHQERLEFARKVRTLANDYNKQLNFEKGLFKKDAGRNQNSRTLHDALHSLCRTYNDRKSYEQIFMISGNQMIAMPCKEIFPISTGHIAGFPVSCAVNPFFWNEKKDPAYTEYLAGRREKVMKKIDDMCRDAGIDYFAMSNLLIGAVIYHDVMPLSGQRNMDIGFLRKDYDAFIRLMREKGTAYGLELRESLDGEGRYPLPVKTITETGNRYSQARVRPLAFDKVPEHFYLYQGLRDEIDAKNDDYKKLIKLYDPDLPVNYHLPESLGEEKIEELTQADPAEKAAEIEELARSFADDDRSDSYMWITFGKSKIITGDELFPLQRVSFRNMEVNCPKDTSIWQPVLDEALQKQVSCIQRADLILLEEFDKVCQKLGVGYFICGGTMLGYMRHGGFIPWDDDVDVAMLRADYDRFMKEAGPLLPDRFFLQTRETDPNIPYLFSKIRLDDTEYITRYNEKRKFHKGICLDIFPFDFLPDNEEERARFVDEVKRLSKEHHLIARRQYPVPEEEIKPRNEQERRYITEQKAILEEYWKQDLSVSQQVYLDAATRYNSRAKELKLRTVGSFVPSYTYIDLNDLLPYQRGKFENIEVSVPKRPDIFLEMQYKNYMELPPKHQQVAHRLLRWKTWEASGQASSGASPMSR